MKTRYTLCRILTSVALFTMLWVPAVQAEAAKTLSLTPFTVNAQTPLDTIQKGMAQMLYSRLSWRDRVVVIPPSETSALWSDTREMTAKERIQQLAKETGSDYIIVGSITELAGSFSIDARVIDIKSNRYGSFFQFSDKEEDLIDKVDRLAAEINQKVFNRSTYTWEQMEAEKEAKRLRLKRQNPEYLLKKSAPKEGGDEKSVWKIWDRLF